MIGKQGNEKKLVVATDGNNEKFGEVQNRGFKTKGNATPAIDNYFGQFFEGEDNRKTLQEGKNIKDMCKKAYETAAANGSSTTDAPTINDVVKYCSFQKLTS